MSKPRFKVIERTNNSFTGFRKGCEFNIWKDEDCDWYIQVSNDGGYLFDGYSDLDSSATLDDVIAEAIEGSML